MDEPEVTKGQYKRIFAVLFQLTKVVNSNVALPELLKAVAKAATELVGGNSCSIMLLDESKAELLSKASQGLTREEEDGIRFKVGEGIAGWVAEHGAPALVADAFNDPRFKRFAGQQTPIGSLLCVPLSTTNGVIGVITATHPDAHGFAKDHEDLLAYLGNSIVKDIENARLYRLAITDQLTKAFNRQFLIQRLPDEIERCRRYKDPLSVVLFDVDFFKKFNDTWGHAAGDFVLKEVARLAMAQTREVDAVVRYGGEEFLFLLPKTALDGAQTLAERFRLDVANARFPWSDQALHVTVSLGVATLGEGQTDEVLLKRADDALYRAKAGGRNRVELAE